MSTMPHDRNARRQAVRPSALGTAALLLVPVLLGAWLSAVPATAGATVIAGTEEITQPGSLTPLDSGGSETLYGVVLPSGAGCPGDTAHEGYHIFSYLVPKGVSPASVSFKRGRADKGFGYIAYGMYYGAINTALGSGLVAGLPPDFTWARLTPNDLFPKGEKSATWEGGIACANTDGVVTNYWNSEIVFTASTSDPRGFTWRVVAQPTLGASHRWLWIGVALIVLSVLLAALAVFLSRRRDESSGGPSPSSDGTTPPPDGTPSSSDESDTAGHDAPEPSVAGR
ncbi:MAG: hypothetical protein ABSC41_04820 [Acidimicrobiales bacterium]